VSPIERNRHRWSLPRNTIAKWVWKPAFFSTPGSNSASTSTSLRCGSKSRCNTEPNTAQFADAAFPAKTRNLLAVNLDGQFGNAHAKTIAEMEEFGNC
jgi:hypothetical protein